MSRYRWDDFTGKAADKHSPKEKPVDKDDHEVENLGRAMFDNLQFVEYREQDNDFSYDDNSDPYGY